MSDMTLKISCKAVSNFLKGIINENCEEGFKWFPEVDGVHLEASAWDLLYAISVLDKAEDQSMAIEVTADD